LIEKYHAQDEIAGVKISAEKFRKAGQGEVSWQL
jgi:hypothetical protein